MMRRAFAVYFLACFFFTGCSGTSHEIFSGGTPQVAAQPDSVSAMLADSADRAADALQTLASVEYKSARTPALAPVDNAPPELRRAVTVNWIGPAETITKTLSERAGYTFNIQGNPPPVPLVVSLDVENKPVIEVLRNIGLQLGNRADVRVDGSARSVEISYPPTPGFDEGL